MELRSSEKLLAEKVNVLEMKVAAACTEKNAGIKEVCDELEKSTPTLGRLIELLGNLNAGRGTLVVSLDEASDMLIEQLLLAYERDAEQVSANEDKTRMLAKFTTAEKAAIYIRKAEEPLLADWLASSEWFQRVKSSFA